MWIFKHSFEEFDELKKLQAYQNTELQTSFKEGRLAEKWNLTLSLLVHHVKSCVTSLIIPRHLAIETQVSNLGM